MSHSHKKTPIHGISCCESDKWYKRYLHKKRRAQLRERIEKGLFDLTIFEKPYGYSCKDGKRYFGGMIRKNPSMYLRLLRK